jgi:hypothetical protein
MPDALLYLAAALACFAAGGLSVLLVTGTFELRRPDPNPPVRRPRP